MNLEHSIAYYFIKWLINMRTAQSLYQGIREDFVKCTSQTVNTLYWVAGIEGRYRSSVKNQNLKIRHGILPTWASKSLLVGRPILLFPVGLLSLQTHTIVSLFILIPFYSPSCRPVAYLMLFILHVCLTVSFQCVKYFYIIW